MRGKKIEWQQWMLDYLAANLANTKNQELAERFGVSVYSVVRKARELGLWKSQEFIEQCKRDFISAAAAVNRGGGNRGVANLLLYGPRYRFRKGETRRDRLGAERDEECTRKAQARRNESIKRDRLRIKWGLEQLTRMKLVREPVPRRSYRHSLKKRGYIIPCRGSLVAYYTDETLRSTLVERRAANHGLTIKPYNNEILQQ